MRKEDTYPDVDWRAPGGAMDWRSPGSSPQRFLSPEDRAVVAWQTAIARTGPSWPVLVLRSLGWFANGISVLDYGSGRGADVEYLRSELVGSDVDAWDPAWGPQELDRRRRWDRVLLTYVLNVLPPTERHEALLAAWKLVRSGGWLLVSTRADVQEARPGRGGCTQYPTADWCRRELTLLRRADRCREIRPGRIWAVQKL